MSSQLQPCPFSFRIEDGYSKVRRKPVANCSQSNLLGCWHVTSVFGILAKVALKEPGSMVLFSPAKGYLQCSQVLDFSLNVEDLLGFFS